MVACRGVAHMAPCFTSIAGPSSSRAAHTGISSPLAATRPITQSRLNSQTAGARRLVEFSRKKEYLRIKSVAAEFATDSSTTVGQEEAMIRRADAYFAADTRPIVLFDGVCNFCNGGVNFVLDNDLEGRLRFAALQSEAGRALLLRSGRSPDDVSSLVLVEKERSYIKSEGVLRCAKYLGSLLPLVGGFGLFFPLFFRDFLYDNVANNRYSILGQRDVCRVSDPRFKDRFVE